MVNSNQDENQNEDLKLSPLGTDEINSVIKSFKIASFNQEELYKKDKKNFVKKSLFDLAKEAEKTSSNKNQSESDDSKEKDLSEKKIDANIEVIQEYDENNNFKNTSSLNNIDKNHNNKEKEAEDLEKSNDELSKSDEVFEEKINSENDKDEEVLDESIDKVVESSSGNTFNTKFTEPNKIEYEEKTLEALDSVREAVTKSLEENNETQNKDNKNNAEVSQIISNDTISEINLINTLFKNIREITNDEIENIVKSKVIELAEDVIGYQIEKFPDKFLNKIKNSINEIKSINNDVKIYLNDHDFELLNKFIEKNKADINFKLDLDSSLGRGDFTVDMGGVIKAIKYKKVIE